jgi:phosphoribosylformylglycinamidine cyclo-ligase
MAHITGGGLLENIPRILPANCSVEIHKNVCPVLPIFEVMKQLGNLEEKEMYRTFNMGVGLVMITAPDTAAAIREALTAFPEFPLYEIGKVVDGQKEVRLI